MPTIKGKKFLNPKTKRWINLNSSTHRLLYTGNLYGDEIPMYPYKKSLPQKPNDNKRVKKPLPKTPKRLEKMKILKLWKLSGGKGKMPTGTTSKQLIQIIKNK